MIHSLSRRQAILALGCTAVAAAAPAAFAADTFPAKPIHIVVGYSAGGAVDAVARTVGQVLSASLGQPVIVDNKPGAGTNIAVKAVVDAPADGYTLLMAANALSANPSLYQPSPFDPEKQLVPVSLIGRVPVVIAANPSAPYTSVAKLVEAAKAKPGFVQYATPGNGSTPHMAMELFAHTAGIQLQHVPYRGGAPAITDVIGGQVPLVAVNALEVQPHAKAGKLKVVATLGAARTPIFPDAPTVAESGFPGFEASVWYGLVAPAGTPPAVLERLHTEVQKALQSPTVRERMVAVGGEVLPGTAQSFGQLIHNDRVRYEKLVHEARIKPD